MKITTRVRRDNHNLQKSRIMIIDDTELNIAIIMTYLKNAGFYNFERASDGQEALNKLHEFQPDLIILDLMMPIMDGFEVIRRIRSMPEFQNLPIIIQTGMSQPEQQIQAWKNGANDVVVKPIHHLELVARVNNLLKTKFLMNELEEYYSTAADDISLAFDLQLSLLPSNKNFENIERENQFIIKNMFRPSRFLSGDLWGIKEIDDKNFAVWLCDFSGKGIRASMNTFRLHTLITEFNDDLCEPQKFLYRLNNSLKKFMSSGNFATFLYGVVNREENTFTYSSASSTAPIIYSHIDHSFITGDSAGMSLGVMKDVEYQAHTLPYASNHSLVLYSDLLWESPEVSGISFEENSLPQFFDALPKNQKVYDILSSNLNSNSTYSDDLTFIEIFRIGE